MNNFLDQIEKDEEPLRPEPLELKVFVDESRAKLFLERNRYRKKAEQLERRLISMQGAVGQVNELKDQLHRQRIRSFIVIGLLLFMFVVVLGANVLWLESMKKQLKQETYLTLKSGNSLFIHE